jgi:hypothetical protein
LFEVRRHRCDIGPRVSNQDHSAVVILLIEKFAASILKLADHSRQTQRAFGRVAPVKTLLMRFRIIESQGQTLTTGSSTLFNELRNRSILLAQLSDAVLEVTNSMDGTEDQPGAEHDQTQVQEHQRQQ